MGISVSFVGQPAIGLSYAPIGSFSSAYTAGDNLLGGQWYPVHGSFTTANQASLVASLAASKISHGVSWRPPILFWST
jgi:hypothetical protein